MASFWTDGGQHGLSGLGTIDWAANTIKARLVLASVTPSRTATAMTGLTAVGTDQTLGSKTQTNDTTNHRDVYDCADPTWSAVAGGSVVRWIVIYKFVTNDADSIPIAVIDITSLTTNGSDVLYSVPATGLFYIQN